MKKTNQFIILFLIFIITLSFNMSYAHSVELDPENLITFPMFVMGGKGTISVKNSISNYTLYYQAVEIPNSDFEKIEDLQENGAEREYDGNITEDIDNLTKELNSLHEVVDNAKQAYEQGVENNLEATEIEKLKSEWDEALANYRSKYNEVQEKYKLQDQIHEKVMNEIKELIPTYIENNWKGTTDNTFAVDLTQFSGKQAFAVWVKLVTSDGTTYYDEAIYSMNGTKKVEETKEPEEPETQEPSSGNKGQGGVDGTLVKSSTLPRAGVTYTVLFAIIVFAVLGFVIYRKDKDLKLK